MIVGKVVVVGKVISFAVELVVKDSINMKIKLHECIAIIVLSEWHINGEQKGLNPLLSEIL